MEIFRVTLSLALRVATALSCLAVFAGCSSIENVLAGDKVDYKSKAPTRASGLEVPPDLTQLSKDSRYQQQPNGTISASTFQATPTTAPPQPVAPVVAPETLGAFKIERLGNDRWLSTTLTPEQVFPQVRTFWKENGFNLVQDR